MSGLEAIGAIAAAAQLATYSWTAVASLQALRSELQTAPVRIQQRADYLDSLIEVVNSINQTTSPHPVLIQKAIHRITANSTSIKAQVADYLQSLQGRSLKRAWTAVLIRRQEQDILKALTSLEYDKTNLVICLTGNTYSQLLAMDQNINAHETASAGPVPVDESIDQETHSSHHDPTVHSRDIDSQADMQPKMAPNDTYSNAGSVGDSSFDPRSALNRSNTLDRGMVLPSTRSGQQRHEDQLPGQNRASASPPRSHPNERGPSGPEAANPNATFTFPRHGGGNWYGPGLDSEINNKRTTYDLRGDDNLGNIFYELNTGHHIRSRINYEDSYIHTGNGKVNVGAVFGRP